MVTNTGPFATKSFKITDQLQAKVGSGSFTTFETFNVNVNANPVLSPGEKGCYAYSRTFARIQGASYRNLARAEITNYQGHAGTPFGVTTIRSFSLPSTPVEKDKTASLTDTVHCPSGFSCTTVPPGPFLLSDSKDVKVTTTIRNNSLSCGRVSVLRDTATLREISRQAHAKTGGGTGQVHTKTAKVDITTDRCQPTTTTTTMPPTTPSPVWSSSMTRVSTTTCKRSKTLRLPAV